MGQAQTPPELPKIKPIETLWLLTIPHFPGTSEEDAALTKKLKEWQTTGVFDAVSLLNYPPTFAGGRDFAEAANALVQESGVRLLMTSLTVGKEGWESSNNPRLARKFAGTHYEESKALTEADWLESMKRVKTDMWGWVPEQSARMPRPDELARSAGAFARFAKGQKKQAVVWMTAQALTRGQAELMRRVAEAARADADYFVWMDLEEESLRAGEPKWRETMGQMLEQILALTPKEKTVIQWINHPRWPAKDVAGTLSYINVCQAKGINHFAVLAGFGFGHNLLDQAPWHDFYRSLPKAGGKQ